MTVVETPFLPAKGGWSIDRGGMGGIDRVCRCQPGKWKSGGVRVIYYFHNEAFPVFLLTVYAKNQKANLTKAERNELKALVPMLVKTYEKARTQ